MEPIANANDLEPGASLTFAYKGARGILVKSKEGKLVAYSSVCPHEAGTIEWDASLGRLLCECHLAIFDVDDGALYRQSSVLEKIENLTPIKLTVDQNQDVHAV